MDSLKSCTGCNYHQGAVFQNLAACEFHWGAVIQHKAANHYSAENIVAQGRKRGVPSEDRIQYLVVTDVLREDC